MTQGVTVVRALCVFYYEKREKVHFFRNRMRAEMVKMESSITREGRKCINLVIESSVDIAKKQSYYEKSTLGEKSRNRK